MCYIDNSQSDISLFKSRDRESAESIDDLFDKSGVAILMIFNGTSQPNTSGCRNRN